jgi:hypothetical protein
MTSGCTIQQPPASGTVAPTSTLLVEVPSITAFADPEEAIYNETYMHDCKELFPTTLSQPAAYQGLRPLHSNEEQLAEVFLGQLLENSTVGEEHIYYDPGAQVYTHIDISDGLITKILVSTDADNTNWLPLRRILEQYGCPDLVYAVMWDDPLRTQRNYDGAMFVYFKAGLRVVFRDYPINYANSPASVLFEESKTLDEILYELKSPLELGQMLLVNFSDAVQ